MRRRWHTLPLLPFFIFHSRGSGFCSDAHAASKGRCQLLSFISLPFFPSFFVTGPHPGTRYPRRAHCAQRRLPSARGAPAAGGMANSRKSDRVIYPYYPLVTGNCRERRCNSPDGISTFVHICRETSWGRAMDVHGRVLYSSSFKLFPSFRSWMPLRHPQPKRGSCSFQCLLLLEAGTVSSA